jgi:hypothetical protein
MMAYVDEAGPEARPVLLLRGNPTWGFLYRSFIVPLMLGWAPCHRSGLDWCGYSDHPGVDAVFTLPRHIAHLVSFYGLTGPSGSSGTKNVDPWDRMLSLGLHSPKVRRVAEDVAQRHIRL